MRILVYEAVSAGTVDRRDRWRSLLREGRAMLTALVADLARLRDHEIVTVTGPAGGLSFPRNVEVMKSCGGRMESLDSLAASVDAVWLIAPETGGCLEQLTALVERHGKMVLGSRSTAIRQAADKSKLSRRLARFRLPYPETRVFPRRRRLEPPGSFGFPVVVKPARGAGGEDVYLARDRAEFLTSVGSAHERKPNRKLIVQRYVDGVAASVSVLGDGKRAVPLALNAQSLHISTSISYRGGSTPLAHPRSEEALSAAAKVSRAVPGLRGYFGVDVVLTEKRAIIVEINPRLTTAYLGVRAATDENVAKLAIDACLGRLPRPPAPRRHVQFTADGHITSSCHLERRRRLDR
jgi:predicted ATP-grasp superfamily ATP-dependent carboligase